MKHSDAQTDETATGPAERTHGEADAERRWWRHALPLVFFALAAAPYLTMDLWYDEAFTLVHFAEKGLLEILTGGYIANNHILFTLCLYEWKVLWLDLLSAPLWTLRLLPFAFGMATVCVLYRIGRHWTGLAMAGVLAATLAASSHVLLSFTCQLRGYGLSYFLVALCLLMALEYGRRPRFAQAVLTVVPGALAIATVPTNLLPIGAVIGWLLTDHVVLRRRIDGSVPVLALGTLPGLIPYVLNWSDVLEQSRQAWGWESHLAGLSHLYLANVLSWAPVVAAAAVLGILHLSKRKGVEVAELGRIGLWPLALFSVLLPILGALPFRVCPYPRVLATMLPIWAFLLTAVVWRSAENPRPVLWRVAGAQMIFAVLLQLVYFHYVTRDEALERQPQNLLVQYYNSPRFRPSETAAGLKQLSQHLPAAIFLTDRSDIYALGLYSHRIGFEKLGFVQAFSEAMRKNRRAFGPGDPAGRLVLVSRSEEALAKMLADLPFELGGRQVTLVADTGYFNIYALEPAQLERSQP